MLSKTQGLKEAAASEPNQVEPNNQSNAVNQKGGANNDPAFPFLASQKNGVKP